MFENAGGKLRSWIKAFAVFCDFVVLITGAILIIQEESKAGVITIIGGLLVIHIAGLIIMARLECYENVYEIRNMIEEIRNYTYQSVAQQSATQQLIQQGIMQLSASQRGMSPQGTSTPGTANGPRTGNGWICPKCGQSVAPNAVYCNICGTKRV